MDKKPTEIPQPHDEKNLMDQFQAFVEVVRILRRECPWDKKQTHESISHLLIEEAYETLDAIAEKDDKEFSKELGDLMLHIVMHGVMAEERGAFALQDVLAKEREKLVHRHPHVFGNVSANDEKTVKENWEQLKMKEGRKSALEGVPGSLPALLRAQRMQEKAANIGFDWDNPQDVWGKVEEEIQELFSALGKNSSGDEEKDNPDQPSAKNSFETQKENFRHIQEEFGDVLFSLVNAARFANIIAEDALQAANKKFQRRFQLVESHAAEAGKNLRDMTLAEMDEIWDQVKREENTDGYL